MRGTGSTWRWHSPAGERVAFRSFLGRTNSGLNARQGWCGFDSGTSALAAALAYGQRRVRSSRRVALPAYSCPSLVSAVVHANLEPVFLDCEPDALAPSAASYQQAIVDGCSLIVLVDLFGVPAPVGELATQSLPSDAWLVHDRAQSLCGPGIELTTPAHAVVASFGRGKPISLLSGGAVACREHDEFRSFAEAHYPLHRWIRGSALGRAVIYNLALSPSIYSLIARLPGLGLGETHLVKLAHVARLPDSLLRAAAMQARVATAANDRRAERCLLLSAIAAEMCYREPHSLAAGHSPCALNRFPLLCATETHAESLFERGHRLGVSRMYRRTLPEFLGRSASIAARDFPNAFDLSRRLVTLPTHARLTQSELFRLRDLLDACR